MSVLTWCKREPVRDVAPPETPPTPLQLAQTEFGLAKPRKVLRREFKKARGVLPQCRFGTRSDVPTVAHAMHMASLTACPTAYAMGRLAEAARSQAFESYEVWHEGTDPWLLGIPKGTDGDTLIVLATWE